MTDTGDDPRANGLPSPYIPVEPVSRVRSIAVIYRKRVPNQKFTANGDTWIFLDLRSAYYLCGYSLDLIMLMDGISQFEVHHSPEFLNLRLCLKRDGVVMEAP